MDRVESKRERHRQRSQRRYLKQAADSTKGREIVKQLFNQRCAFLALHAQAGDPLPTALQRYVDSIALADRLWKEKQLLVDILYEREFTQHRIAHITDEATSFPNVRAPCLRLSSLTACLMTLPWSSKMKEINLKLLPSAIFRPLSVADCRELASSHYDRIQVSMRERSGRTAGRSVLGWSDGTQVNDFCINVSMQKDIAGLHPTELSRRTWEKLFLATDLSCLYSAGTSSTLQCLQVVDQDNIVLYERLTQAATDMAIHSLYLVSRFKIDNGYVEIMQPLDRSRRTASPEESAGKWTDTNMW